MNRAVFAKARSQCEMGAGEICGFVEGDIASFFFQEAELMSNLTTPFIRRETVDGLGLVVWCYTHRLDEVAECLGGTPKRRIVKFDRISGLRLDKLPKGVATKSVAPNREIYDKAKSIVVDDGLCAFIQGDFAMFLFEDAEFAGPALALPVATQKCNEMSVVSFRHHRLKTLTTELFRAGRYVFVFDAETGLPKDLPL